MKKVALVFVVAVLLPSLVLAWLAVRSLRDQQFVLERQQSLLYQGVADAKAAQVQEALAGYQHAFTAKVNALARSAKSTATLAKSFDDLLRRDWPLAQVGFVVTLSGEILSASTSRSEAQKFYVDNSRFLSNRELAEVYLNPKTAANNPLALNAPVSKSQAQWAGPLKADSSTLETKDRYASRAQQTRKVTPQQQLDVAAQNAAPLEQQQLSSKITVSEAEFRQLIGEDSEGALARFVDNKLSVLFWCRPAANPGLVLGAQLSLPRLIESLRPIVEQLDRTLRDEICLALLDDAARPAALSHRSFRAPWKRPFVATEAGETLPHWEIAVYLLNPAKLKQSARALELTLGLLISLLVFAIGIGSWLIVADLNRQLRLARQKTDFVSNVSHELKTPLTSIRMFSELLAEGRVNDPAKQRSYLGIITAEAARLTRLINNVLDFARLERGEKKYNFQRCDVVSLARETAETYRPHLEAQGFQFDCQLPESAVFVNGDRDALAQVIVNLLSNAEKYSDSRKEISLRLDQQTAPLPHLEVKVLDRGLGVPPGAGEKIFEKFYRAHDSLSSGIQGSGLGLTLARQIARAHQGDVAYQPRSGGGSCFTLRLPLAL